MATRNHSRKPGRRKRQSNAASDATAGSGVAHARPEAVDSDTALDAALEHLKRYLEPVMSAIIVCVGALRDQDAEHDEEIARVLRRSAGDPLDALIETIGEFLMQRKSGNGRKEAPR